LKEFSMSDDSRADVENATIVDLVDKSAIHECLLRYCRGADRRDLDLLKTAFWPDATADHGAALNGNAWDEFTRIMSGGNKPEYQSLAGQHHVTNHLIEVAGDVAHGEAYALAYYLRESPDGGKELASIGLRYINRFEKRDGEWRIAHRISVHDWDRVDPIEKGFPAGDTWAQGRRGPDDPSYRRS
jgi:hypothetical protein